MNIIGEIVMPVKRWWRLLHKAGFLRLGPDFEKVCG
jgi:hypothetical protein